MLREPEIGYLHLRGAAPAEDNVAELEVPMGDVVGVTALQTRQDLGKEVARRDLAQDRHLRGFRHNLRHEAPPALEHRWDAVQGVLG